MGGNRGLRSHARGTLPTSEPSSNPGQLLGYAMYFGKRPEKPRQIGCIVWASKIPRCKSLQRPRCNQGDETHQERNHEETSYALST